MAWLQIWGRPLIQYYDVTGTGGGAAIFHLSCHRRRIFSLSVSAVAAVYVTFREKSL